MKRIIFFFISIIFLVTQTASAHHLWVEKEGDRFTIAWGHPPKIDPYEPGRVKDIKAFDIKGEKVPFKRTNEKDKVYLSSKGNISMITLSFEGGYLVSTPDGKKRLTKREAQKAGLQVIDSFYSSQFVKSLFANSDASTKPVGMKFEIIPLINPFTLRTEEPLPIKVLFEGKPLEGVTIEIGVHKETTKTDKDGIAKVQVTGQKMQVILARYRVPARGNPDADYLSYTTVLTMEKK
jgi:nickel transport protein